VDSNGDTDEIVGSLWCLMGCFGLVEKGYRFRRYNIIENNL
jgi:hypothetical protein